MDKCIQISWDDEAQRIVRYDFDYGWTWADLDEINQEMAKILDTVDHDVCLLVVQNYSEHYIPPNPLSKINVMLSAKQPRVALSVVVSESKLVLSIFSLLFKLNPNASHMRLTYTVDKARLIIHEYFAQKNS